MSRMFLHTVIETCEYSLFVRKFLKYYTLLANLNHYLRVRSLPTLECRLYCYLIEIPLNLKYRVIPHHSRLVSACGVLLGIFCRHSFLFMTNVNFTIYYYFTAGENLLTKFITVFFFLKCIWKRKKWVIITIRFSRSSIYEYVVDLSLYLCYYSISISLFSLQNLNNVLPLTLYYNLPSK